ncbi:MAG: glycosyltransferase [Candidatus Shapirobacteria bacterium]|nr:glycosyltransferase [Candidatus Shapirobacteria bacterium]
MKNPYFSIIIPCLNEENYLPELLKNLNSQSFTDFETIVVDGNSEDKTCQVTNKFKASYPLSLYSTTTRNVSFQRNLGAKKAKGKIFIFFDADTQIPKNYLNQIAKAFKTKHPHFLTTYLKVDSIKPLEKIYAPFSNLIFEAGKFIKSPFAYGSMQAIKKGAFFDVGGYDIKTKYGEDGQLFQKLHNFNYKYLILKKPRYIFSIRRYHSKGILKSIIKQAHLNLNVFRHGYHAPLKEEYQMGGKK